MRVPGRRFGARHAVALKFVWFSWFRRRTVSVDVPPEIAQARSLIQAIDRGGIPLNPARVNAIARNLGLEVSRRAPVEQTIERIRACLRRV